MRIAQVCHRFYPNTGGIEKHVYEISKRIAKKFEVYVITADRNGLPETEIVEGIKIVRFRSLHPSNSFYVAPQLYVFLKRNDYDVVHAHNYHALPSLFASFACERFVFTPHYHGRGGNLFRNLLHGPYRILGRRVFERAKAVICVSKHECDLVIEHFGIHKGIRIVPNGIDLKEIRRIGRAEEEDFVLYVGRLEAYKNVDVLVKAMKYIPEMKLYVVGEGSFKMKLEKLAYRLGLSDRILFLGKVSEERKFALMKACSVFVNLSSLEAFGITVLEALACGSPVVVNGGSGLKEFAEKFDCVFTTDLEPKTVAERIKTAMGCDVRVNLKEYDWDNVARRVMDVYESVVKG